MQINNKKILHLLQNIQYISIILIVFTLPYFIAPSFSLLLSSLIFLTTMAINNINLRAILKEKTILFLFLFIILTYISALWSPADNIFGGNFRVNINAYLNYFLLIPGIYFSNLAKDKIKFIFTLIIFSPFIYVILYFTNFFGITNIYSYHYNSITGNYHLYVDLFANIFILFSAIFLYIKFLSNILIQNYKKALFLFIPLCIVSLSLFIDETTISRLINLSFLVSIFFVSIYMISRKQKLAIAVIIGVLSVIYIYTSKDFERGIVELQCTYKSNHYDGSWGHRTKLAQYGINMWLENPYFGRGTVDIIDKMRENKKMHPEDFNDPTIHFHNQHILMLVQVGVFGYILFLIFIYNLFTLKIKDTEVNVYKKVTVIIFLTIMLGEHYLQMEHTSTFFALLVGLFLLYKNQELKITQ